MSCSSSCNCYTIVRIGLGGFQNIIDLPVAHFITPAYIVFKISFIHQLAGNGRLMISGDSLCMKIGQTALCEETVAQVVPFPSLGYLTVTGEFDTDAAVACFVIVV